MTPKFAQAVDPIFLHVVGLLDRIGRDEKMSYTEERLRVRALIDQADAMLGASPEWDSAKYALSAWIDEMLVEAPWEGRDWWSNNVLEMELFSSRSCYEQFFVRAKEASALSRRDALEVYYVCIVLGFRGFYRDPAMAQSFIQAYGLPADLETWAKQVRMTIRLGQGRPPLGGSRREIVGAPPMRGKSLVVWSWLLVLLLICTNIIYFVYTRRL